MSKYTTRQIKNFWNKVSKADHPKGCWEWTAAPNEHGYGVLTINNKMRKAHRVSWELANGEIPNGLWVLHECDNPKCVNPNHLFLGTRKDNIDDMMSKNRQQKKRGEEASNAILTEAQVREIRRRYKPYSKTDGATPLAKEFNVSFWAIWGVISYANWKHIE